MIIDINGYLGRWGIRCRGIHSGEEYLSTMSAVGIDKALVTSTVALVTDTQRGNDQLLNLAEGLSEHLLPVACINPKWGMDETLYHLDKGYSAFRLYPGLHNYSLTDFDLLDPLMTGAGRNLVLVTAGVTPHFNDMAPFIGFNPAFRLDDLEEFAARYAHANIVVTGYAPEFHQAKDVAEVIARNPNVFFETSNWVQAFLLEEVVKRAGVSNILFGSGSGILEALPALEVIRANVSLEDCRQILGGNALKLIGE
jgi:predicted TIM-barrel fold metal-dependent hydrolase